mmetsp:Transcript_4520/g.3801  ORF Transcript_4520/g.3801 Transcript_4520/m.3801 type:complete len:94 (+) Transcript_4520:498-779(+)
MDDRSRKETTTPSSSTIFNSSKSIVGQILDTKLKHFHRKQVKNSTKFIHSPEVNTPDKVKETFKNIRFTMTGFKHKSSKRVEELANPTSNTKK